MPIPIDGISSAASACPIVTKPTSLSLIGRPPMLCRRFPPRERAERLSCQPPRGRVGPEGLLDDQGPEELDRLLATVFLGHHRILVLEREHVVVPLLEQRGHDA